MVDDDGPDREPVEPAITVTLNPLPPSISGAQPGVALQVGGTLDVANGSYTFALTVNGIAFPVTFTGSGPSYNWTAEVRFYFPGNITVHATGTAHRGNRTATSNANRYIAVTLASLVPDLTIEAPTAGPVAIGEAGELVGVRARTSNLFGPRTVRWELDSASGDCAQDPMQPDRFNGQVPFSALPLGNRTVTVRCRDRAGHESVGSVTLVATDVTPPHLLIVEPQPNQAFVAPTGGVTVHVRGQASDVQSGMLGGRVEWSLTGAAPFILAGSVDGWANWEADIPITDYGAFTITIRAIDHGGSSTMQSVPIQVVSSYRPSTLEERLAPREYLAALLAAARDHIRIPDGMGGQRTLSTSDLQTLLHQPFGRLSQPLSAIGAVGLQPVNELRVPIEVLRDVSGSVPALLAGRWTFDVAARPGFEVIDIPMPARPPIGGPLGGGLGGGGGLPGGGIGGLNNTVFDVSGNGTNATLLDGAALAPTSPASTANKAVDFGPNGLAHLEIPHSNSLTFAENNADFSVTFRLFLRAGANGNWQSIGRKGSADGERTFALFLHPTTGAVHARITTTASWNEGLDGATTLPTGRWVDLAYVKRGVELCLYVDGVLDGRTTLAGDVVANTGPITFGRALGYSGVNGMLDDLRIYRLALSPESIAALAGGAPELPPRVQQSAGEAAYRQGAYEALLIAAGSGFDELRLARTGDAATRSALAARLGIPLGPARPDQLDQLLLDPAAVTEAILETLFGLADTNPARDVLRPATVPTLLGWRLTAAAVRWSEQDHAPAALTRTFRALIDPDLVTVDDLADPSPTGTARALLDARVAEVAAIATELRELRTHAGNVVAAWAALLNNALPAVDLAALNATQAGGGDISPQLAAVGLSRTALAFLTHIAALVGTGTVTESEWRETEDVLVQVRKEGRYATWRSQESAISISPEHFKLSGSTPVLLRWRSTARARRDWTSLLATRVDERQTIVDGYAAMLVDVEQAMLPALRDAVAAGYAGTAAAGDALAWLTERYALDMAASGTVRSTRIEAAVATLQELLFSVRAERLPRTHPAATWNLDSELRFDEEMRWTGDYDGWRSAMLAWFYPENLMLPSLRPDRSQAFADLLAQLTNQPSLAPADARTLASNFLAAQLPQLFAALPAPAAVWSFDEASGKSVVDALGASPGTLTGGAGFGPGQFRSGLEVDGRSGRAEIAASAALRQVVNTFTISMWVRPDASHEVDSEGATGAPGTAGQRFAYGPQQGQAAYGHNHAGVGISVGTNGVSVYEHSDNYLPAVLVWTAPVEGWTHIAVVYNDRKPSLYVNGVKVRERNQPSPQAYVHVVPDGLGGMQYGWFRGGLDEVRVYAAALTPEHVELLAFRLTDRRTEVELNRLSTLCRRLMSPYGLNAAPYIKPEAAWLAEIFCYVPLLMGLRLQASGEYLAALDWLQNVYAHHLPPDQRKVYYGLSLEHNTPLNLLQSAGWAAALNPHVIAASRPNPLTRFTLLTVGRCSADFADAEFTRETVDSLARARGLYVTARELVDSPDLTPVAAPDAIEPALPNPTLTSLRAHIQAQQSKMRQGRNIAGMPRVYTPPATGLPATPTGTGAPTGAIRPVPYHYRVLVDRAKQLVALAEQVEGAYLGALEKFGQAEYQRFQANQGLEMAKAGVELQALRITEASAGITLAQDQKNRADVMVDGYDDLINRGLNTYEEAMLSGYNDIKSMRDVIGGIDAAIGVAQSAMSTADIQVLWKIGQGVTASVGYTAKAIAGGFLDDAEAKLQANSLRASHESRVQDWKLQRSLAQQESLIAAQQVSVAVDHLAVARQEAAVAQLQVDHAKATVDFLDRQFTNRELYEWMSGVLSGVYRFFLQQATATARMAQDQLAFERQESASFIQSDYWQPPATGTGSADRRGLTGSARLLQDVYQLDQFAFMTEKRKLNLTQTISLAQLAPLEFEIFRSTGVLSFATPMSLFDSDFPGHYLRLIKRIKLSMPALVPPNRGIRAQLLNSGISRVVTGGDFRQVTIRRDPELVALTATAATTGVFDLDAQSDLLFPFEAMGVDTTWELQLPRAANPFDYATIADVLLTIEYTALHSMDYRAQVVESLNAALRRTGDRVLSLRRDFPDAWYDLLNPSADATARTVAIHVDRADLPSNLEEVTVAQVGLCAIGANNLDAEPLPTMAATILHNGQGGEAQLVKGLASTRRGSASTWLSIAGTPATGTWTITLPLAGPDWANNQVTDILLMIGYAGVAPAWPT